MVMGKGLQGLAVNSAEAYEVSIYKVVWSPPQGKLSHQIHHIHCHTHQEDLIE